MNDIALTKNGYARSVEVLTRYVCSHLSRAEGIAPANWGLIFQFESIPADAAFHYWLLLVQHNYGLRVEEDEEFFRDLLSCFSVLGDTKREQYFKEAFPGIREEQGGK